MLNWNRFEAMTFDCYGTLIDWETGILQAVRPVLTARSIDASDAQILETFAVLEKQAELELSPQGDPPLTYKEVLITVMAGFGERFGFWPKPEEIVVLRNSVKDWLPFPDTVEALKTLKRRWKLGILSNIDDNLFALSAQHLQVDFDWVITAEQIGSYKPSLNNFKVMLQRIGIPKERVLHLAQSLHHDIRPAKELGLATAWVNRRLGKEGPGATAPAVAQPDLEVPDLETLVKAITSPSPQSP